jgi:hypothetical protein
LLSEVKWLFNATRQIVETVDGQLSEQFNIEANHTHTFWGLCTRLYSELTAHTLCLYQSVAWEARLPTDQVSGAKFARWFLAKALRGTVLA